VENKLEINSDYPLELHMMNLQSELESYSAESTYARVIVWNTMPTSEHLQCHFDKFDLLQLEEERLASGKFDIIEKSESTYERFLYAHYPEQESIITIFVKVNLKNDKYPSSLKFFIEKVDSAFKKYGLIGHDGRVPVDPKNPNSSFLSIRSTVIILIIFSLFIWLKLNRPGKKEKICQNKQKKIVSSSYKSISVDQIDENKKNSQEQQHADSDETIS
jgi:hypothetical protein